MGLALPCGPTGSRWGPGALGPDGGLPVLVDPTSTAGKVFTPFAQAATLHDSIGVNTHPYYVGTGFDTLAEIDIVIDRLQQLGVRHVRGLGLYSPAVKADPTYQKNSQWFLSRIHDRNLSRDPGVQPIFCQLGTIEERKWLMTFWEPQNAYELFDADGGEKWLRPLDGPAGVVSQTGDHWAGTFYSQARTTSGTPIGWHAIEMLTGPNEPDNGRVFFADTDYGIRWVSQQLKQIRDDPARVNVDILEGEDYVDFDTGRIEPGPAKVPQLPVVPFSHFVGSAGWNDVGDYTDRQDADVVGFHQYWGGHPPIWDYNWGSPAQQAGGNYGWMHNANAVNGALAPGGVRYNRSIPLIMGETGYRERDDGPGTERGCPPDISGEYLLQIILMNFQQGPKRTYVYRLHDENESRNYGLCDDDWNPKPNFHALANLLALVGFRQGPGVPISVPHSFTPGPTNFGDPNTNGTAIRDICMKQVLEADDGEYLIILSRPRVLWNRQSQVRTGGTYVNARNVVLTLPAGDWTTEIAEPAKNPILDPDDGQTYANPGDGQAYAPPGVSGNGFTRVGNTLTVRMGGLTRVVRITANTSDTFPTPLPGQTINKHGLAPTFAAADPDGHTFAPGPHTFIDVRNTGGVSTELRVPVFYRVLGTLDVEDVVVTVPAGQERMVGPFPAQWFGASAALTVTPADDVDLAVFEF